MINLDKALSAWIFLVRFFINGKNEHNMFRTHNLKFY